MSDPKGPFEAAVRAACHYPHGPSNFNSCCSQEPRCIEIARAVLAAALPPEPAPETIAAMWDAYEKPIEDDQSYQDCMGAAYRALRASLLPGEEPS